jgi:hypothetical protein
VDRGSGYAQLIIEKKIFVRENISSDMIGINFQIRDSMESKFKVSQEISREFEFHDFPYHIATDSDIQSFDVKVQSHLKH